MIIGVWVTLNDDLRGQQRYELVQLKTGQDLEPLRGVENSTTDFVRSAGGRLLLVNVIWNIALQA